MTGHQQQQHGHGAAADYYAQQPSNAYQPPNHDQCNTTNKPAYEQPPNYESEGSKADFQQTFKIEGPKFHDIWAGALLIIVFLGFVAVSGLAIHGYAATKGFNGGGIYDGNNDFGLSTGTIVLFAFVLAVSLVLSWGYVSLARLFPKQLIWATGILNIILGFGTAIYMLSRHYWSGGIVFLLFSIFTILCFWSWIPRIPFSALMLETSVDVSKHYGHVYLISFIGGIITIALAAWYEVTLVAVYVKYEPSDNGTNPACSKGGGGCSHGKVIGLLVFVTFAAFWISEWLKNTVHTIVAGVYGSWYFCKHNFPHNATRASVKRATTYSFGSISLGSLFIAIINTLRFICANGRQTVGDGGFGAWIFFFIMECFLRILDWIVEFINRYAFVHIALYGKAYIAAAKDTWRMIKDRGIDALVNQCLIGPVFNMGAIFVGFACALVSYCYLLFTDPGYNQQGQYTPVVVAIAFLIGLQICNVFTTPLSSGIDTIFVATAWDPEVLKRDHPDLYDRMVAVYPRVHESIHA